MSDRPSVLFVCVHNAGRSQMAAGFLTDLTGGQVDVRSAGSIPADQDTMGCGDACPIFPGKRYEDWKLDDPAGQGIAAVRPIRDEIRGRVEQLLAELLPTRA